jgi:hypothetical protein
MNYRFKRRSFLATLGGAVAFQTMLENLEAAEAGAPSPPRLLAAAWPVGTIRYHYLPLGGNRDFTMARILMPFETLGLREDLVILYGLTHAGIATGNGGGPEAGTVMMMTGADSPGCRENGGEQDDTVAGGPSFDQILLKHSLKLQRPGKGYANAIGDARVDSNETSTQCFSYSHVTREIQSARPGGLITENTPLLPKLHPVDLYTELFSGFVPGGDPSQMVKDLRLKKSVLDGSLRQLARLGQLAPAGERTKVEIHTEAVRKLEQQLSEVLAEPRDCDLPPAPDAAIQGKSGSQFYYGNPIAAEPDEALIEQIGKLHLATIRAAFQCDLVRVATFAWTPSQPDIAMVNLDPSEPDVYYMHHPLSHRQGSAQFYLGDPPGAGASDGYLYEAMVRANIWYFQKYAEVFAEWKTASDAFGGSLLDHTVIPLMTDTANAAHVRSPLPALILGGKALGMQGGQFLDFQSNRRPHNDLWLTVAQAFFPDAPNVLDAMPGEVFLRDGVAPIEGLWQRPT